MTDEKTIQSSVALDDPAGRARLGAFVRRAFSSPDKAIDIEIYDDARVRSLILLAATEAAMKPRLAAIANVTRMLAAGTGQCGCCEAPIAIEGELGLIALLMVGEPTVGEDFLSAQVCHRCAKHGAIWVARRLMKDFSRQTGLIGIRLELPTIN